MQGHVGVALGHRVNNQVCERQASFVVSRGWGAPWFPWEEMAGLSE